MPFKSLDLKFSLTDLLFCAIRLCASRLPARSSNNSSKYLPFWRFFPLAPRPAPDPIVATAVRPDVTTVLPLEHPQLQSLQLLPHSFPSQREGHNAPYFCGVRRSVLQPFDCT